MCFKTPKPPPKDPADIALEKELEAARAVRKRELAEELRVEKDKRTEMAIARAMGLFGGRSLIAGPKGGAGFIGFGSGRVTGRGAITPSRAAPGSAPAIMGSANPSPAGYSGGSSYAEVFRGSSGGPSLSLPSA